MLPDLRGGLNLQLAGGHRLESARGRDVYSMFEDKDGNIWFGTVGQDVCRYDGNSCRWYRHTDLNRAIRCIFQDRAGDIWFGTNGGGVWRFDGAAFTNFTAEKGLSKDFPDVPDDGSAQLNRVWSVGQDNAGNIWFGTADEGLWRYDGKSLTNYTIDDGLSDNFIWFISKDKSGDLLFCTGIGLHKYVGKSQGPSPDTDAAGRAQHPGSGPR